MFPPPGRVLRVPDPTVPRYRRRTSALRIASLVAWCAAFSGGAASAQEIRLTPGERAGFQRPTSHDEMWAYLEALRASSTDFELGAYGKTWEGRDLPFAIFARPTVSQPYEAWATGRPVVVLAANVHGGERTLREALLVLMRDLATPGSAPNALLDQLVVLTVPQINPDGFEATEWGTRGNARGVDLNRDYVKLEHPEIRSFVGNVLQSWQPHLFVDGHNGGSYPYNLNYLCPSHADPDPRLTALCDDEIFPAIDRKLGSEGLGAYYYQEGDEEEWRVGGYEARIARNYSGFANMVGMLFESPPGQDRETAVRAGYLGYLAALEYAASNADRLIETVDRARRETILMGMRAEGDIVVEMEYGAEPEPATYQIARRGDEAAGGGELEVVTVTGGRLMKRPIAVKTRPRPWAYILPPEAREAVEMLRRHRISIEVLREATPLTVDAYTLEDITYEEAYDHAAAARVTVGGVVTVEQVFPTGSFVVRTGQVMGRLVAHMLEPETTDNVVYWNTMDAWLPKSRLGGPEAGPLLEGVVGQDREEGVPLIPIFKLMRATPLPARRLEG
jgi:dipeptidyl-peptidase-4